MRRQVAKMAIRCRESAELPVTHLQESIVTISTVLIITAVATSIGLLTQATRPDGDTPTRPSWTLNDDSWNQWWSYSGVSGPSYWGLLNTDWFMCERGRRQSPIDLNTKALVYDAHLTPLQTDNNLVSGALYNDGHSIVFNGSLAAMMRLVRLREQAANQERAQSNNVANLDATSAENATSGPRGDLHLIQKRDSSIIFALDEHTARVELVGPRAGFVVDGSGGETLAGLGQSPPMLVRELGNNVDLSISESDRLQSESLIGLPVDGPELASSESAPAMDRVHFTGAGTAYSYRFEALQFKFGPSPSADAGSEHQIDGRSFAGELQLFAYNWQLYRSYDEALTRPHGLLAVSILVDSIPKGEQNGNKDNHNERLEGNNQKLSPAAASNGLNGTVERPMTGNEQLERLLTSASNSLNYRGAFAEHRDLNLSALMGDTDQFVTYEGSLTQPSCHETVTWLILNRPLYISKQILDQLRTLSSDEYAAPNPTGTFIAGNTRPVQPVNQRPIRTNIRPAKLTNSATNMPNQEVCPRLWTQYKYSRQTNQPKPA